MRIDPAIAALRRDRAPQRRAQAAMAAACEAWRAEPDAAEVVAELERFGQGAPLAGCPALESVFATPGRAAPLIHRLVAEFCAALRCEPFGGPPFRNGYEAGHSTLILARSGRAQLILCGSEPGRREFSTAGFSDAERYEVVLAGRATARLVRRAEPSSLLKTEFIALAPGFTLALDLGTESLQVLDVERQLVVLRLFRTPAEPGPSREYDLASGTLLRQSAGDLRASRHEMMLSLLGRMGRTEAAPLLADVAKGPGGDSLRWQALRECLALDTAAGFEALCAVARAADDPLAAQAGALRAQLVETYPQLLALESGPCPA